MMPDSVAEWVKNASDDVVNITGSGTNGVKNEICNDSSIVAWTTHSYATPEFKQTPWGRVVWNRHVVLVDGFRNSAYRVIDPIFRAEWVDAGTYEKSSNITSMAVTVR